MTVLCVIFQAKWRALKNGLLRGKDRFQRLLGLLLGAVFLVFFGWSLAQRALAGTPEANLPRLLGAVFAVLVVTQPTSALHNLLLSKDLELLLAAPLKRGLVFLVKFLDVLYGGLLMCGFAGVALVTFALHQAPRGGYTIAALGVVAWLALTTAAFAFLLILLAVRVMPEGKLRGAIGLVSALTVAGLYLGLTAGKDASQSVFGLFARLGNVPPVAWCVQVMTPGVPHLVPGVALLLTVLASVGLAYLVFRALEGEGFSSAQTSLPTTSRQETTTHTVRRPSLWGWWLYKEGVAFWREPRRLLALLMPLFIVAVISFGQQFNYPAGFQLLVVLVPGWLVALLLALNLALPLFPYERRNLAFLKLAPLEFKHLVYYKSLFASLIVVPSAVGFILFAGWRIHLDWRSLVLAVFTISLASIVLVGLAVMIGMLTGDFETDDVRRAIGCTGSLYFYLGGGLVGLVLLAPVGFADKLCSLGQFSWAFVLISSLVALGVAGGVVLLTYKAALRKFLNWEETAETR